MVGIFNKNIFNNAIFNTSVIAPEPQNAGGGKVRRRKNSSFGSENSLAPDDTRQRKIAKSNATIMVLLH